MFPPSTLGPPRKLYKTFSASDVRGGYGKLKGRALIIQLDSRKISVKMFSFCIRGTVNPIMLVGPFILGD